MRFESLVNTEGFQTVGYRDGNNTGLRVLLIQKDFKLSADAVYANKSLRVLLIQKDFKHTISHSITSHGLRVLLIQKDFKLMMTNCDPRIV